jgi:PAS domain S-box-containing protein
MAFLLRRYRVRRVDVVAAACVAAYFVWLALRTPGTPLNERIGEWAFYPLGLAVAWASWLNALRPELDRRTRMAWGLLALSSLSLWFSGTIWSLYIRWLGGDPLPGWVDRLELGHEVLALAGYLLFPRRRLAPRERPRFLLDAALTLVAGFVVAFHFGLRIWLRDPASPTLNWATLNSLLDWIIFIVAAVGCLLKRDRATRVALGLFLLANTTYLFGVYGYVNADGYQAGHWVDGVWFMAWAFRWTATRAAWYRYEGDRARATGGVDPGRDTAYSSNLLAYSIMAVAFALQSRAFTGKTLDLLPFSASVMASLLLVRQFLELRENRALFAERAAQEQRFRSLVQNSSDVVLVLNDEGAVSYVSTSAARLFGEQTALRAGARLGDLVAEADRPTVDAMFAEGRILSPRMQTILRTDTGVHRDVELSWTDLRADPNVGGFVVNCRDVTERNSLERTLRHAQKLDAVGHMAGGFAHDLNNVLMVIRGYAEVMRTELPDGSPTLEDLAHVEDAVDRATSVTGKLLAFSRRQPAERKVLDLNVVLRGLEPMLRQLMKARVEVRLECDASLGRVWADPGQIEQVLVNLATNARDAMPDGGTLRISTRNGAAAVAGPGAPADEVILEVVDTGVGMTPEVQARVFEPFFSTKPKEQGVGLGLAMVHGIVADSGGRVGIHSVPGSGTTFTIAFPKTDRALDETRTAPPPGDAETPLTVLVVDDEPQLRTVVRRMLENAGYRVVEATDGQRALDVLEEGRTPIDLVLTDMLMPGLHGRELIARVRQRWPGLAVLGMTGFADEAEPGPGEASHLHQGVTMLRKPFSVRELMAAVAKARPAPVSARR